MSKEEAPRSFAVLVGTMCDEEANAALSEELHRLLNRLRDEANARCKKVKGSLRFELALEVDDNDIVGMSYSIKTKAPELRRQTAVMWLDKNGHLTPENPRQQKLPLREVTARRDAPREIEEAQVREV